jgi:hypothetical protein
MEDLNLFVLFLAGFVISFFCFKGLNRLVKRRFCKDYQSYKSYKHVLVFLSFWIFSNCCSEWGSLGKFQFFSVFCNRHHQVVKVNFNKWDKQAFFLRLTCKREIWLYVHFEQQMLLFLLALRFELLFLAWSCFSI